MKPIVRDRSRIEGPLSYRMPLTDDAYQTHECVEVKPLTRERKAWMRGRSLAQIFDLSTNGIPPPIRPRPGIATMGWRFRDLPTELLYLRLGLLYTSLGSVPSIGESRFVVIFP
jgi:hypothetical protein